MKGRCAQLHFSFVSVIHRHDLCVSVRRITQDEDDVLLRVLMIRDYGREQPTGNVFKIAPRGSIFRGACRVTLRRRRIKLRARLSALSTCLRPSAFPAGFRAQRPLAPPKCPVASILHRILEFTALVRLALNYIRRTL